MSCAKAGMPATDRKAAAHKSERPACEQVVLKDIRIISIPKSPSGRRRTLPAHAGARRLRQLQLAILDFDSIEGIVEQAREFAEFAGVVDARQRAANATVDSVKARISSLTTRERQIMELVLAGKFNKVIADELNISMRTVEVHRANLFEKMQVKTAVELANLVKNGR